jgi:hypothetical protein
MHLDTRQKVSVSACHCLISVPATGTYGRITALFSKSESGIRMNVTNDYSLHVSTRPAMEKLRLHCIVV